VKIELSDNDMKLYAIVDAEFNKWVSDEQLDSTGYYLLASKFFHLIAERIADARDL